MSVKVIKVETIPEFKKNYTKFNWLCGECDNSNEAEVDELVILQYKSRNLGPMEIRRKCEKCGAQNKILITL